MPAATSIGNERRIPLNMHGSNLSTTELATVNNIEAPLQMLNQNKSVNFFGSRQQKRQNAKIKKFQ